MLSEMPAAALPHLTNVADSPAAEIVSVAVFDAAGRKTTTVTTGEAISAEVTYMVHEPVKDAVIEIYFYSVFGNLHCHFTTDVNGAVNGAGLNLLPGRGVIEFTCPEVLLEVAAFNIEASIKHAGSAF